jgi:uncharacterized protein (TIGR00297 family)
MPIKYLKLSSTNRGAIVPVFHIFSNEWITFTVFLGLILGFVGFSEVLRKSFTMSGENTRQFVHVGVGLLVMFSPFLLETALPPAILAVLFIVLNAIAIKSGQMKGMHTTERFSLGTVFFPVSFLVLILLYWVSNPAILIIGMLIMTLADPLASIVGTKVKNSRTFTFWVDTKTSAGSLTVFLTTFLIILIVLPILLQLGNSVTLAPVSLLLISFAVAIIAALSESISFAGSDNLTLPLLSALFLDIMLKASLAEQITVVGWISFSFLLAFAAYRLKALTLGGTAGAMLLGSIVFSIGGIFWVIPMATFFVLSSIMSKIGKIKRTILKGMVEKGSQRDILQVYANGGVSLVMAVLYHFTGAELFYLMFLGSLAAATADTWGTEIGIFARRDPRHILTFDKVPAGTSGGVTVLGTSGFFIGAGILTLSGIFPINDSILRLFIIVVISGILGAFIDSILGATIQAQYRCPNCQKTTEKLIHCGSYQTALVSGIRWIDNDVVNFVCTSSGALLVALFHYLLM